jgi:4-oxalocrotonate tautomerase
MPWVTINLLAGHSAEKKSKLHKAVAEAVYQSLDIPPDWVKVQLIEMAPEEHSIGGITIDKLPQ